MHFSILPDICVSSMIGMSSVNPQIEFLSFGILFVLHNPYGEDSELRVFVSSTHNPTTRDAHIIIAVNN